jgi:hypothetical protein
MKKQPSQALQALINMRVEKDKRDYPNVPKYARVTPKYDDSTSNGLSKCIIEFLNMQDGCYCGRISNEGVMRTDKYGKSFRVNSSMQNGISDLDAVIWGRSVKIEVKINKDVQSPDQKEYQRQIENAKGYYLIAKNFEDFYYWFTSKFPKANE